MRDLLSIEVHKMIIYIFHYFCLQVNESGQISSSSTV